MADASVRPFEVQVPEKDPVDLRRRVAAARWPGKELVADRSQGGQLATIQNLVTYRGSDDDWRTCEAKPNALPQFETEVDDLGIHFIFVRSDDEDALPLVITHGGRAEDASTS
jgi:hypothetical protein